MYCLVNYLFPAGFPRLGSLGWVPPAGVNNVCVFAASGGLLVDANHLGRNTLVTTLYVYMYLRLLGGVQLTPTVRRSKYVLDVYIRLLVGS